ncbi:MAG: penicillin-binding protein 2 [Clostridia bacterium]|nr:penicillin-binding protein 2 [Clostridia bacterium]
MRKRAILLFIFLMILFSGLGARIFSLSKSEIPVRYSESGLSIDVETVRGTVYDCNMKPLTNAGKAYYAAVRPSETAVTELKKFIGVDKIADAAERLKNGKPIVLPVDEYTDSSPSVTVFSVPERYGIRQPACHIIGYLDSQGRGISGIEKAFDEKLFSARETASVRFRTDARGRIMNGCKAEISGCGIPESGVVLTIDRDIQQAVEDALDRAEIECGCAVVVEVGSGAIRACASRPVFDPMNIAASLSDEDSPLINRAFCAYNTGSVFKSVIASAALENGIGDFAFDCMGSVDFSGVTFNCHKKDGHSVLDLEQALMYSCNTFFASLGQLVGSDKIVDMAKKFGFGEAGHPAQGITSASGNLPSADELDSAAAIANISFGQGALTATPLQICSMTATIAAGGVYYEPFLVSGETDGSGNLTEYRRYSERKQVISEETADFLCAALRKTVTDGSGKKAGSEIVEVSGKTATAQTGRFTEDGEIFNAWFSGFFPSDAPEYSVTVMIENGGEGASSAAPVFKDISEAVTCIESRR